MAKKSKKGRIKHQSLAGVGHVKVKAPETYSKPLIKTSRPVSAQVKTVGYGEQLRYVPVELKRALIIAGGLIILLIILYFFLR